MKALWEDSIGSSCVNGSRSFAEESNSTPGLSAADSRVIRVVRVNRVVVEFMARDHWLRTPSQGESYWLRTRGLLTKGRSRGKGYWLRVIG